MKRLVFSITCLLFVFSSICQQQDASYIPAQSNIEARKTFQDMKFGMFIHWGIFSLQGEDAWVMNDRKININDYKRLIKVFNPIDFDAHKWVMAAKNAGMKYITFITRHHDGFSNWDTKQTDWKITNTKYAKDVFKMLADECHQQGIKLFVYYSLLDWSRNDYPRETGKTGQNTGRTGHGDYAQYLQFMKAQLTELLTNYGEISGVWLDGHWDQTEPEGARDRTSKIDWHYNDLYATIHKLQPQCLIGNNHHLTPFDGEDFQMFEHDLPGQNNSGLSFQEPSQVVPLETCETMNDSWGYNIADRNYKTKKQVIRLIVSAAGRNANLLLNVGPMANGEIQPEFLDTLASVGTWMKQFGNTVYGTKGTSIPPQPWGVVTGRNNTLYLHILNKTQDDYIFVPGIKRKIRKAGIIGDSSSLKWKQQPEGTFVFIDRSKENDIDTIIELETE